MPTKFNTLRIDKGERQLYENIKSSCKELSGFENKDLFMLALFFGYKHGSKHTLGSVESYVRLEYLNDRELGVFKAIALEDSEGKAEVLLDLGQVLKTAEEYASWGVRYMSQLLGQAASFSKQFEGEVVDAISELEMLN